MGANNLQHRLTLEFQMQALSTLGLIIVSQEGQSNGVSGGNWVLRYMASCSGTKACAALRTRVERGIQRRSRLGLALNQALCEVADSLCNATARLHRADTPRVLT